MASVKLSKLSIKQLEALKEKIILSHEKNNTNDTRPLESRIKVIELEIDKRVVDIKAKKVINNNNSEIEVTLKDKIIGAIVFIAFCAGLFSIFVWWGLSKTDEIKNRKPKPAIVADETGDVHGAWAYMTLFVEKRLKNPSSASYPWMSTDDKVKPLGNNRYLIKCYVDSKNSFDGTVRTNFNGIVKRLDGKWALEYLNFE